MEGLQEQLVCFRVSFAIPFKDVKRLLEYYPYGYPFRIALELIALTGMRGSELNDLGLCNFLGDRIIWKPSKHQSGTRIEKLDNWFIKEFQYFLQHYPHGNAKLFTFNGKYIRCNFDRRVRQRLGGAWVIKRPVSTIAKFQYLYQLKGLRHNFGSLNFYNDFKKWGDGLALEKTAKRMCHSSYKMTAGHYLDGLEVLELEKYEGMTMGQILKSPIQTRLIQFL